MRAMPKHRASPPASPPSPSFSLQRRVVLSAAAAALGGSVLPRAAAADDAAAGDAPLVGVWTHGYAAFGKPKYPRGFANFDYVNPAATKGGTLYLRNPDRRTSFDKFNGFTLKGAAPGGITIFMLETLAVLSGDEPQTMYGLLAEEMLIAPDKSSVTVRLHPKARFYNGDPVTAADVKHSFDSMAGKFASPALQSQLAAIGAAVVLDPRTVRFDLKERNTDAVFLVGSLAIFSAKWGLGPDGKPKQFDQIVTEYPITSGPYTIALVDSNRRIEFARNPGYWARDLPVRRGFFNFDRVVYRYYKDNDVAREAFRAGEFDILKEYSARSWVRQHKGPKWESGQIIKDPFPTAFGQMQQAFDLNLRRPKFQDLRVRRAIDLTYDFKMAVNRYGEYTRGDSMFANTEFAARGTPSPEELALLEPFRKELPPEVFGPAFVAPRTDGEPAKLRANLLQARELFKAAGWNLAPDGRLRNAAGEAFAIEYMRPGEASNNIPEWQQNLEKLGARLTFRDVDYALYQRRLQEYDFEMVAIVEGKFTLPPTNDLVSLYGSKAADEKGNSNYRGVKSAAVDSLLAVMGAATTIEALRTASRALDRVVMWSAWQVPGYYTANERASYWNKFAKPAVRPQYYTVESPSDLQPAWPITTWWMKPGPAA
jgi:peptide/nickel transport system substrate-binding protein/microcin C transport system substrate-binding protein